MQASQPVLSLLPSKRRQWRDENLFTLVAREYQLYKLDPMGFASLIKAQRLTRIDAQKLIQEWRKAFTYRPLMTTLLNHTHTFNKWILNIHLIHLS